MAAVSSEMVLGKSGRLGAALGLILIASFGCVESDSPHTVSHSDLIERVDRIVLEALEKHHIPGASVGIAKDGEVLVAKGYGYADLENDVRATEHTVYRIGSVTKQFTAVAIMLLVEDGKLDLDERLEKYFPDYPTGGRNITLDRLLNHTSGIKGMTEIPQSVKNRHLDLVDRFRINHERVIGLFSKYPFEFEPGERYQYSNSGYYLLGVIIEKVSGQSYRKFLQERLFMSFGLTETHYLDRDSIIKNRAEGYKTDNGELINDRPGNPNRAFSAGALGSSTTDLLRWQMALHGNRILSNRIYQQLITPGALNDGSPITYGFGLFIGVMDGYRKIEHGGSITGFKSQVSYYPEENLSVVVLFNTESVSPAPVESRLARSVLGLPEPMHKAVKLSTRDLEGYVGTYDPGRWPYEVKLEEGSLYVWGERLVPLGTHVFVSEVDPDRQYTFEMEEGKAVAVRWERQGRTETASVVKAGELQD